MTSLDLADPFISTRESLAQAGIDDDFFLDLVASRLLVERVGESDNQAWWESRILSDTGRARLAEVTPKTQLKSRITLASKVGRKAESDRLPDDTISLFSFGPQVESRLTAAIDDIEPDQDLPLDALESLSVQALDEGWTDSIITEIDASISDTSASDSRQGSHSGDSVLVSERGYTQAEIDREKWNLLTSLLRGYGSCTDRLQIHYHRLESELKSENA